jgi:serine/threonine protein kinase
MGPELWQKVNDLFYAALEREGEERKAFLVEACVGDKELLTEVESLLSAHNRAGDFIQKPPVTDALQALKESNEKSLIGEQIGVYGIVKKIGHGGMGAVYLAEDSRLDRKVAIKVNLLSTNTEHMQRFVQEARAVSALNHPNIITIFEIGKRDSIHFIVTEFVDGANLRDHIVHNRLSLKDTLEIATQVASALAAAHAVGIIHRDIKPENVMVRKDGYVKVLDFGIAKLVKSREEHVDSEVATIAMVKTNPNAVIGTVRYMSPEQARSQTVDARADVWSLGVMLYEMVTGRLPFEGDNTGDTIASILKTEPAPLTQYKPNAPDELQKIISKALTKNRDERYQTMNDFALDLKKLSRDLEFSSQFSRAAETTAIYEKDSTGDEIPLLTKDAKTFINTKEPIAATVNTASVISKKFPLIAVMATLALVALIGGGIFVWSNYFRKGKEIPQNPAPLSQTMTINRLTGIGKVADTAISPDGKYVAYVVEEEEKQSLWVRQLESSNEGVQLIPPSDTWYGNLTFSPDSELLYFVKEREKNDKFALYQVPVLGGEKKRLIDDVSLAVSFSPDGKQAIFARFSNGEEVTDLIIANLDGSGEKKLATREASRWMDLPTWSPDGKIIAFITLASSEDEETDRPNINIAVLEIETGREKPLSAQKWSAAERLTWLHDGSGLMMLAKDKAGSPKQIWQLSYPNGEARNITNDLSNYTDLSLTNDAKTLCAIQANSTTSDVVLISNFR